ncbi:unnamed protein product [Adineta ricciae]|uniref:Uncharacterized protein n=1 Tax=Adineta ricciae TaxID=249248 RepID=A0A814GVD3_ADIRI|nr:unnamed protein product [Adineta ricciae]CAF1001099.1 unnamed protein product [Adineta ricciae]CAF1304000.1 unnamed protein product [Adineta ricciae]
MFLREPHVPFISQSCVFDWERDRLEAAHRVQLFPPPVTSLRGPQLYGSPSSLAESIHCPALISRPDLHRDQVATNYRLMRPMPSSYHCLLDPARRLKDRQRDEECGGTTMRFDEDTSNYNNSFHTKQPDFTWYHNNETEIGKTLPENYWNRHKLAGTSYSGYLVPTIL